MKWLERHDIPSPVRRAIRDPYYSQGVAEHFEGMSPLERAKYQGREISVTALCKSPRERLLVLRHDEEIEEDEYDAGHRLFGHVVHEILRDFHEPGDLIEQRLAVDLNGYYLHGQADRVTKNGRRLEDYKVTSAFAYMQPDRDIYVAQVNLLGWIFRRNGYPVEELSLNYILRDFRKSQYVEGGDYPRHMFPSSEVPVWGDEECEEWAMDRVVRHMVAAEMEDDDLPYCNDAERWVGLPQFKVFRRKPDGTWPDRPAHSSMSRLESEDWVGDKTAELSAAHTEAETKRIKKLKDPAKATRKPFSPPEFEVREVPGEPVKCAYCKGISFCSQRIQEISSLCGTA